MQAYFERDGVTLYHGDCLDVLADMPADSIDTCITDPPYGLEFMGKDWDNGVPGARFWREVLRVLKPGAMLLAFGGTRTHHRLMVAIEDAGFELRDVMMWIYGSGFPKSHNISKAIDKAAGAEREVVGKMAQPASPKKGTFNCSFDESKAVITAPATPEAARWDGWGTALKPAWEPIILAMKPRDGTFVNNALTWGVAGLWIDGGRVDAGQDYHDKEGFNEHRSLGGYGRESITAPFKPATGGRWPANLIHDGSDEVVGLFPDVHSRGNVSQSQCKHSDGVTYHLGIDRDCGGRYTYDKTGSAARFFYCAKASRSERDAGLDAFPLVSAKKLNDGGIQGRRDELSHKAIADAEVKSQGLDASGRTLIRDDGTETLVNRFIPQYRANHHPTVKPLALMRYLCKLTRTPTGGVVLDPFAGSGSTGCAAVLEGREFVGIDKDADYCAIAAARIEHHASSNEAAEARQLNIFRTGSTNEQTA